MTIAQALYKFWSSFDIPAYQEDLVPNDAKFPYITYEYINSGWNDTTVYTASIWYSDTSWLSIETKTNEISKTISLGGIQLPIDNGTIWLQRGTPFAQAMGEDNNNMIRRMYLNMNLEFNTIQ